MNSFSVSRNTVVFKRTCVVIFGRDVHACRFRMSLYHLLSLRPTKLLFSNLPISHSRTQELKSSRNKIMTNKRQ